MEATESKRFEDYPMPVDCNECESYWTNACDGVPQGSERRCNSFSATRKIVIPAQINALDKRCDRLTATTLCMWVALLIHVLTDIFGG